MNVELLNSQDLSQGNLLSRHTVEKIIGFSLRMKPDEYGFQVMNLQALVESLLTEQWGDRRCKTRIQDGGIKIMTEQEIVQYYEKHWRSVSRSCAKASEVLSKRDTTNFSAIEMENLKSLKSRYSALTLEAEKAEKRYPMRVAGSSAINIAPQSFKDRKRA